MEQPQVTPHHSVNDRWRMLADATRAFVEAPEDDGSLLDTIARKVARGIGDACAVFLLTKDGKTLAPVALDSSDPEYTRLAGVVFQAPPMNVAERPAVASVLQTGEPLLIPHLDHDAYAAQTSSRYADLMKRTGVHSLLIVPLRLHGRSIGILTLNRFQPSSPPYEASDRDVAQVLADCASLAIGSSRQAASRTAAETRFARLSDAGILGIMVCDLDGQVTEINDALLKMVGYGRDEVLSGAVRWTELTPPGWEANDEIARAELLGPPGVARLREKEYVRKDGSRLPILIGTAALEAGGGQTISFVLDVTERQEARAALERLRAQTALDALFRNLLEAAPDAMVITDRAGIVVLVNEQTERLFGYARGELLGQPIEVLVSAPLREAWGQEREALMSSSRATGAVVEKVGLRKDGSEFPAEISSSRLETPPGVLVSSAIRDLTGRKEAEAYRAQLAALVEASDDAIIGKTLEGTITSWNDGARRIFGYEAAEIVGRPITVLVPPEREDEERKVLERLARDERVHFETVRRRKDGREIHVSVTSCPVHAPDGSLVGASKIARDITEQRAAAEALARARDRAEAANRELEAFSYSVAHDLRAPLRGMNGFAHIVLDAYADKLDDEGKDALGEIIQGANRMATLIDALLALARLTRSALHRQSSDLAALARAIVAQLRATEPARQVELVSPAALPVHADPTLARALLENLLGNAWKFTSSVPSARIEIGEAIRDQERFFFVRDDGAGFDMAYAKKLFTPFQRLHRADEFPGTGIGLATVQRIVHRHGGRVWAEGVVGAGATFYFSLPDKGPDA